ncbi:hypothetical protein J2Z22_002843 [Paenibacillus forsythiae]|uniref:Uncharacterized protein n=1 Tax=Paenibacillus forsythiae TaxID=365616 RepID=A0ABU3HB86_9BACL|nr:hypothetical protein [Paenibacillus forsythiae]MDT3427292.1 hypothetical protein [Paenibacillus forsythiae]
MAQATLVGTREDPSIIDAQQEGDPFIKWTYDDPENDTQEKYRLEVFMKDGLLAKGVENTGNTGNIQDSCRCRTSLWNDSCTIPYRTGPFRRRITGLRFLTKRRSSWITLRFRASL